MRTSALGITSPIAYTWMTLSPLLADVLNGQTSVQGDPEHSNKSLVHLCLWQGSYACDMPFLPRLAQCCKVADFTKVVKLHLAEHGSNHSSAC